MSPARLGYCPSQAWMTSFYRRSAELLGSFEMRELAMMTEAASRTALPRAGSSLRRCPNGGADMGGEASHLLPLRRWIGAVKGEVAARAAAGQSGGDHRGALPETLPNNIEDSAAEMYSILRSIARLEAAIRGTLAMCRSAYASTGFRLRRLVLPARFPIPGMLPRLTAWDQAATDPIEGTLLRAAGLSALGLINPSIIQGKLKGAIDLEARLKHRPPKSTGLSRNSRKCYPSRSAISNPPDWHHQGTKMHALSPAETQRFGDAFDLEQQQRGDAELSPAGSLHLYPKHCDVS